MSDFDFHHHVRWVAGCACVVEILYGAYHRFAGAIMATPIVVDDDVTTGHTGLRSLAHFATCVSVFVCVYLFSPIC